MLKETRYIFVICLFILIGQKSMAQMVQDFNRSANQIGDCWQHYNMYIETKNTINSANQKKALTGRKPVGKPAYHFTSPIIEFNGTGSIEFRHKLTENDGVERVLKLYLLDQEEKVVQTLLSHTYRTGGTSPSGNATNVLNETVPINWQGIYMLRWVWEGVGGSSVGMVDDISIDGTDQSDGSNDNGYGYCREDDVVYDIVCAGTQNWELKVPYVIQGSDWTWSSVFGPAVGTLDSTVVTGPMDSLVHIDWAYNPGSYVLEATEIRPPYNTTTYSITFYIEVLDNPRVNMSIDSVCYPGTSTMDLSFTGSGPWVVSYTDGVKHFTDTVATATTSISLPTYSSSKTIKVTSLTDASGCAADPGQLPSAPAIIYPRPSTGLIQH